MFLDDAAWIASIGYSSQRLQDWRTPFASAMVPHMARVAFEGQRLVVKRNPPAAGAIEERISAAITAVRHAGKLLDDRKRDLPRRCRGGRLGLMMFTYVNDDVSTSSRKIILQEVASSRLK